MASYSYKELCYQIPEYINKAFVDEFKREPDGDPGYDGDCWTLAAMYVEDLIKQRDELLEALEDLHKGYVFVLEAGRDRIMDLGGQCDPVDVMEIGDPRLARARAVIAKAKGGAVNHFTDAAKMVPYGSRCLPVRGLFDEDA